MIEQLSQRLIGYRVKAAREAAGWTQDCLAEAMDLKDRQSVSDIENGKRALKPDELVLLTDTLDRELDFFLDPFQIAGEAQFSSRNATVRLRKCNCFNSPSHPSKNKNASSSELPTK